MNPQIRIHFLQHIAFEGLGNIQPWIKQNQAALTSTQLWQTQDFPATNQFDWLIVTGGPMGFNDYNKYPWLKAEKRFIEKAIQENKIVIGICLGAQLIANVLGSTVFPNQYKEIGWFPVEVIDKNDPVTKALPNTFTSFHWHGDTFELPQGAKHLMRSKACEQQAFSYNNHVYGFQFHMEMSVENISQITNHCSHELVEAPYIQQANQLMNKRLVDENKMYLNGVLNNIKTMSLSKLLT